MNIVLIFMLVLTFNDSLQLKDIFNYPAKEITVNENYLVGIIAQNKYRFYYDTCFVNYEKVYVTLNNEDFFAGYFSLSCFVENEAEVACKRYFLFDKKYFCCYFFQEDDYPCTVSVTNRTFTYTECYFVEKNKLVGKTKIINLIYYLYQGNMRSTISYVVSKKTKKYDFEVPKIQINTTTTLDEIHLYSSQIKMLQEKATKSKILKWKD